MEHEMKQTLLDLVPNALFNKDEQIHFVGIFLSPYLANKWIGTRNMGLDVFLERILV